MSQEQNPAPRIHRVVYELNDERESKCQGVLRSMGNHIKGKGGPANAKLALMVHDEAYVFFLGDGAYPEIAKAVSGLQEQEVKIYMCGNTLRRFGVDPSRLLPGIEVKQEGAMVAITDLVLDGYVYLKP